MSHDAKVLILGTSDAGKSTLCRHMRQLYGKKFSEEEMTQFKYKVRSSCLKHFVSCLHDFLRERSTSPSLHQHCDRFLEEWKRHSWLDRPFLNSGISIWNIPAFQMYIGGVLDSKYAPIEETFDTLQSIESIDLAASSFRKIIYSDNPAKHFLSCFDRIMSEGYRPTLDDILNLKDPTTGIFILPNT